MKKMCIISTVESTMNSFIIPAMERFVNGGYDVTLVCNMSEEFIKENSDKFHCVNIPMKRGISLTDCVKIPWKFLRLFRKERFDYVQYATTNASFYAAIPAVKMIAIKRGSIISPNSIFLPLYLFIFWFLITFITLLLRLQFCYYHLFHKRYHKYIQ